MRTKTHKRRRGAGRRIFIISIFVLLLCLAAFLIIQILQEGNFIPDVSESNDTDLTAVVPAFATGAASVFASDFMAAQPLPEPTTPKPDMPSSFIVYDTVIRNGRIINPETNSDITGMNIGIIDGKIAAVTFEELTGNIEFDATGLVVAPGFVDILSFDPNHFGEYFKTSDGVTTILLMHGGTGDAAQWHRWHGRNSYTINFGTSNLMTTVRRNIGYGPSTVMTNPASIQRLVDVVETNIVTYGALGISMSPEYAPGIQGAEMVAMSELAARLNVVTYYHLRYSSPVNSLDGIQEVLDLARKTGVAVHIMHINSTGATHVAKEAFRMIDEARAEGLDITACIYPYTSWATYAGSLRFASGWQERFGLTYSDLQFPNTVGGLTQASFAEARQNNRLVIANNSMPEHEIRYAMATPYVFIASDTILAQGGYNSHPRGAGTFSRTIGRFSRDEGIISLMDAIAKVSYMPARRLESASYDMKLKGRIEVGADADITIFDFNTIIDTATAENVASHSEGIKYVFVAGRLVYDNTEGDNRFTGARPGRPIRSRFVSPDTRPQFVTQTVEILGQSHSVNVIPLSGRYFIDIREIARATGDRYEIRGDGTVRVLGSTLYIGRPDIINRNRHQWMSHEAIIHRGSVFVAVDDLGLFEGQ